MTLDPQTEMTTQLLALVIAALVGAWAAGDARRRGKSAGEALLWGLGVWLVMIVFLPLWLLLRPRLPAGQTAKNLPPVPNAYPKLCRYCGNPSGDDPFYCMSCGRQLKGVGET